GAGETKCTDIQMPFQYSLYATTYIVIFIPGLSANSAALWVLCHFINKKNKAIIFMSNLSVADLAHVLSLPLQIYYYFSHHWPFPKAICLLCFYLKYLDMCARVCFLICISLQRCFFLLKPFRVRDWKRRYDAGTSAGIWIIVGTACLPPPILRSADLANNTEYCFANLGFQHISMFFVFWFLVFFLPVAIITYCTWKKRKSLQEFQVPTQNTKERKKSLWLVLICAVVFIVCFPPYHLNFPFYMMIILCFYIISLCLANLNCCLDPVVYYFMTPEFHNRFLDHSGWLFSHWFAIKSLCLKVYECV
uniref:G-protein coupled receptors family 1 profile domain-containing protein n=1 Tax=Panthera leo TaxID=9689 RepID=A0A8C8XXD3_PANLE